MGSVLCFITVTRPLGLKGVGRGQPHAGRGGAQRSLALVFCLSLCAGSGSVAEGEGKSHLYSG